MKRRHNASNNEPVSLFPFLAVLLCTMGALVVLLMVISRQARDQVVVRSQPPPAADDELELEHESLHWRIGVLRQIRDKTAAQLAEQRQQLSYLEQATERIRQQLQQLQAAAAELENFALSSADDRQRLADELATLQRQIAAAESQLAGARQRRQQRPSYAVLPYQGPHETRRRPVYIECRADAVILQPEGIALSAADFTGLLGSANPLAAGLRAAVDYLGQDDPADQSGQPYPLLLVRPDGIAAYHAAREALTSWDADFGYELIDDDWQLAFPPADLRLAERVARAVDDARQRQRLLAKAAPRLVGSQAAVFRAAPSGGGLIRDDQPLARGVAALSGRQRAPRGGLGQFGDAGGRPAGHGPRTEAGGEAPDVANVYGGLTDPGATAPYPAGATAGSAASRSGQPTLPATNASTQNPMPPVSAAAPSAAAVVEGSADQDVSASPAVRQPGEYVESLARRRGVNWGLPQAGRGSVPITRPIPIVCAADSLTILPDRGGSLSSKTIPLGDRTETSVNELVSAVWDQIETWGIAGRGMYWRPILSMQVAPGGEQRFTELQALLADSGLDVRRQGETMARGPQSLR